METIIKNLTGRFGDKIDCVIKNRRRLFVGVNKQELRLLVEYLFNELKVRFSTATAVEGRTAIEILYHFPFDQKGFVLSLRVAVTEPSPEVDSITPIIEGAEWVEREIHEMFGVNFAGHPKLERFLLPDDWPEGVFPYRKNTFDSEKEVEEKE